MQSLRRLLLCLLVMLLLAACAYAESAEPILALTGDGYGFTIIGQDHSELWGSTLIVRCENTTEHALTFSWARTSVMGYMLDPMWAATLDAESSLDTQICFDDDRLQTIGVDTPQEITFTLIITNADDWETEPLLTKEYTIYPNNDRSAQPTPIAQECVLIDTDTLGLTLLRSELHPFYGYVLYVCVENRTDRTAVYMLENSTVNEVSIDPMWADEVCAGKRSCSMIAFPHYALTTAGVGEVEAVTFSLIMCDPENWLAPRLAEEPVTYHPEAR